jgi:hypothetical protein
MRRPTRVLLALAFAIAPQALSAQSSPDPTTAFLSGTNPSGPWRYGFKTGPLGGLTDFASYVTSTNFARWSDGSTFGGVYYQGDLALGGGTVSMHPFVGGQLSTLRFVAPTAGPYSFVGWFTDGDAASTDVYIGLNNATLLFSGYVLDQAPPLPFSSQLVLSQGDYVDFMVGAGGNGYGYDNTVLVLNPQAAVVATPEPASMVLVATGLLGVLAVRRRQDA